jgi:hypothetical protein
MKFQLAFHIAGLIAACANVSSVSASYKYDHGKQKCHIDHPVSNKLNNFNSTIGALGIKTKQLCIMSSSSKLYGCRRQGETNSY